MELSLLIGEKAPPRDVQSFNLHTDQTDGLINALVTLMGGQNGNSILKSNLNFWFHLIYTTFTDNTLFGIFDHMVSHESGTAQNEANKSGLSF